MIIRKRRFHYYCPLLGRRAKYGTLTKTYNTFKGEHMDRTFIEKRQTMVQRSSESQSEILP